jgi:hypothetical protein
MVALNVILTNAYSPLRPAGEAPAAPALSAAEQLRPADGQTDQFQPGQYWRNRAVGEKEASAVPGGSYALRAYRSQDNMAFSAAKAGEDKQRSPAVENRPDSAAESGEQNKGTVAEEQEAAGANPSRGKSPDGEPLDQAEVARLLELKKADAAVRAHEQAHLAAAGGLAKGGASFAYQKGPDGREYAVAGEVQIDTSKGATPAETIARMTRVRAAALAPADPSAQDLKVAQAASMAMAEASMELHAVEPSVKEQQAGGGTEEAASVTADGAAKDNPSAVEPRNRKSVVTAKAASRYLAQAQGPGAFHLAV